MASGSRRDSLGQFGVEVDLRRKIESRSRGRALSIWMLRLSHGSLSIGTAALREGARKRRDATPRRYIVAGVIRASRGPVALCDKLTRGVSTYRKAYRDNDTYYHARREGEHGPVRCPGPEGAGSRSGNHAFGPAVSCLVRIDRQKAWRGRGHGPAPGPEPPRVRLDHGLAHDRQPNARRWR